MTLQNHLTLRLTRTQGSFDTMQEKTVRVDLPLDATEDDLRRAFAHASLAIIDRGRGVMDDAVELVTEIIDAREAIEKREPTPMAHEGDAGHAPASQRLEDQSPVGTAGYSGTGSPIEAPAPSGAGQ